MDRLTPHESSGRPRVLLLAYRQLVSGPRPLRQLRLLRRRYELTTAGFGPAPDPEVPHIELDPEPPKSGLWAIPGVPTIIWYGGLSRLRARWLPINDAAYKALAGRDWDLILAHDPETVPVALRLRPRRGVSVDLHEYSPRQNEQIDSWRKHYRPYLTWLVRQISRRVESVTTVGRGIADEYEREFGLHARVVENATAYHELLPGPVSSPIRLVHSGSASVARNLSALIEGVRRTSADVTLDLYLVSDGTGHLEDLKAQAEGVDRIRILDPVPYSVLIETLNGYDVGVHLLEPVNFNHRWALPNKFFDYIQARLGIIVGPSPEMERIVRANGLGGVTTGFTGAALAGLLETLTPTTVAKWKAASHAAAKALSSETVDGIWLEETTRLLDESAGRGRD